MRMNIPPLIAMILTTAPFVFANAQAPDYRVLHSFTNTWGGGCAPRASMTISLNGLLYGTASGQPCDYGTIFSLNPKTGVTRQIYHFKGVKDGEDPSTVLIADTSGYLYGTTFIGGKYNRGTVFRIDPIAQTKIILHDFADMPDGAHPTSGLTVDQTGQLYGVTLYGGQSYGTLYKIDPQSGYVSVLHAFTSSEGGYPVSGLTLLRSGKLVGEISQTDTATLGSLFSFEPTTQKFGITYQFQGGADGQNPQGGLITDKNGRTLYGCTVPNAGEGTIFSYDPRDNAVLTIHTFNDATDGSEPFGCVALGSDGKTLYGATDSGGPSDAGTVYSLVPETKVFQVLHSFSGTTNHSRLTVVKRSLFGTVINSGSFDAGIIYSLKP